VPCRICLNRQQELDAKRVRDLQQAQSTLKVRLVESLAGGLVGFQTLDLGQEVVRSFS